jgi:transcription elongation factor Elf1
MSVPGEDRRGREIMTEGHPADFVCRGCGSGYKVVRVTADAGLPHRVIHCKVCKEPLTSTDGEYVLKYFLTSRAKAKRQA